MNNANPSALTQQIFPLTPKQLEERLKEYQVVSTDSRLLPKKPNKKEKVYLSDKNQSTDKNTKAKNTDKFINGSDGFGSAPKSISTKGKYKEKKKGKGVSATDDFLDGVEIGPLTILNTQEFKYSNYYERIRQIVNENWRDFIRKAIKLVKSDEKKYGLLTTGWKITKLEIHLNEKGEILEIILISGSGYKQFDDAGDKAFRKSAPFAAPPTDLVQNGTFALRWDFVVAVEEAGLIEFKSGNSK